MLFLLMKESTQLKFLSFGKYWNYFKGESLICMSSIQKISSFDKLVAKHCTYKKKS